MSSAITTFSSSSVISLYQHALTGYITAETGEEALMQAYELGRRAVAEHCNILDLVAAHQKVILQTIMECEESKEVEEYFLRGETFLIEVMAPFEMMHRGFSDTIRQLQEVNTTLELRVNERTRALQESRRKTADLARLYHILSGINSAIVRLHDRARLFKEACRIAVDQGGYRAAWISPADNKSDWAGDTWYHRTSNASICESRQPSWITSELSLAMEHMYSHKRPEIRHRKWQKSQGEAENVIRDCSFALFPLVVDGKAIGLFALFSDQENAFNDNEIRLLLELAGDLSFALDHIRKEEQLDYLANHDSLTGLPNRNLLLERLSVQLQTAERADTMVALLLLDLVHFSDINDIYGRHVGDNLLRQIGDRLCTATSNLETVARLNADRFAVTFTNLDDAGQVAHRLEREVLESFSDSFKVEGAEIHITVQIGLALFPSDAETADTLYKNSEIALKRAKDKQEPYLLYDPAMNERIIHSVTMEAKLRKAIEHQELHVYYQPKIATADGRIDGMEALLRYVDPQKGLILPHQFIPLMEETGMIIEIGDWVMRQVAEDIKRWRQMNLKPPKAAVNVSPIQLRHKDFLNLMTDLLPQGQGDHGLDIEITESAVMEDITENIPKLAAVREMGFGIAVDDFGTGYSSLSYLSKLPVDALKIDRSFIINMTERPNSLSIVTTIITLAHALEMKVVAEGVDIEEQAKLLRLLRCDLIQGNLYDQPLTWNEMTERLQQVTG